MNDQPKICYPSLDLFLYHLKDALGEGPEKIQENHDLFWQNLPPEITVSLEKEAEAEDSQYFNLLEKKYYPLKSEPINNYKIGGYYYPVLLNDAYGLLLDCCVDDEYSAAPVESFSTLKTVIGEKQGDLGKVWMISGYSDSEKITTEEIAKVAYKNVMGKESQRIEIGKFMEADVFEFWQFPQPQSWRSILENKENKETKIDNSPVIAIIYPDKATMDKNSEFYPTWLQLFCSRQKIFWAYSQCRQHSKNLQKKLSWINQTIKTIDKLDWSELKYSLKLCADYVILLEQMKIDNSAIADNLANYQNQLNNIVERASQEGKTDLKFLEQFSAEVGKYQHQNQQDISKFQDSLSILETLQETVKSLVEIKQAESDRQFQKNIEIVGFGIGLASIVASSSSAYIGAIEEIPPVQKYLNFWQLNQQQSSLVVAVNASTCTGAIASFIIALFLRRKQKS